MWQWLKWVLLGIGVLAITGMVLSFLQPGKTEDNAQPSQFIQADFSHPISQMGAEVMPDSVFAKYQAKGVKDKNEMIITKEYRDTHPLECNGEQFAVNYDQNQTSENFVFLPGYNSSL